MSGCFVLAKTEVKATKDGEPFDILTTATDYEKIRVAIEEQGYTIQTIAPAPPGLLVWDKTGREQTHE